MVDVKGYATIQISSGNIPGIGTILPGAFNTASVIQDTNNINAGIIRVNFTSPFLYPPVIVIQPVRMGIDWLAPGVDPFMPDELNAHRWVFPLPPSKVIAGVADEVLGVPVARVYEDFKFVTSVTRVGSVATVTTPAAHGFKTGDQVDIEGAAQVEYNGVFPVTVTGANTFTYAVTGTPITPATGPITVILTIGRPMPSSSRIEMEARLMTYRLLAIERDHFSIQFSSYLGQIVRVRPYQIDGSGTGTDDFQQGTVNEILFGYLAAGDIGMS